MSNNTNLPGWPKMPDMSGSANNLNNAFTQGLAGSLDFMKNFWGNNSNGMQAFVVPTIDLKELEKRIKDLKAVEGWLDVNINMLRSTIQALEMQHHTIATIHAMSDNISSSTADAAAAMANRAAPAAKAAAPVAPATPRPFTNPFASQPPEPPPPKVARKRKPKVAVKPSGLPPGWPTTASATPKARPKVAPAALMIPADAAAMPVTHAAVPAKPAPKTSRAANKAASKSVTAAAVTEPSALVKGGEQAAASAGAWLNFLQDQFNKVATTAIGTATAAAGKTVTKTATKKTAPQKTVTKQPVRKLAKAKRR